MARHLAVQIQLHPFAGAIARLVAVDLQFDLGLVSTKEPFQRLYNQGMILAHSYRDGAGKYYSPKDVSEREGKFFVGDVPVVAQVEKMSKSKYNVVNPDEVVEEFGADSLRLYEMFIGPFMQASNFQVSGVAGANAFLNRLTKLADLVEPGEESRELLGVLHKTIKKVGEDIDGLRFNTAVSSLMILVNACADQGHIAQTTFATLIRLVAPFAPHLAEELWHRLERDEKTDSIFRAAWPSYDAALLIDDMMTIAVQVNGKLRDTISIAREASEADTQTAALASQKIQMALGETPVRKVIVVPGKIVNIVI